MGRFSTVASIFHIAEVSGWAEAQASGIYRRSTLGRTLEEEGFVHCSYWHQVASVANEFYADQKNLLLLVIDPARVAPEIREEAIEGLEGFPHIYGPLNLDAVTEVWPFVTREDGRLVGPDSIQPDR
ncbi:MAG TPA: DUF952 domain-containing protein [Acidimicrobiales bacterium]|nr:DUF952 domain-containing protein [Acidimicrobiales bacterium]